MHLLCFCVLGKFICKRVNFESYTSFRPILNIAIYACFVTKSNFLFVCLTYSKTNYPEFQTNVDL